MAEIEDGYTRIANEILERMATIKLSPTQYRLLFVIWRYTYGFKRKQHELSLNFLADATGCDRRQIQRELKGLEDKKIIHQTIESGSKRIIGFNKDCDNWSESVGETVNTPIGGIDNTLEVGVGEIVNSGVGETVNTPIGETTNQERNLLKKDLNKYIDDDEETIEFKIIRDHFLKRRSQGFGITLEDEALMRQIIQDGIPVDFIIRCIDHAFDTYKQKHRLDKIHTFKYIAPRCYDEWIKTIERKSITENAPSEPVALGRKQKPIPVPSGRIVSNAEETRKQLLDEIELAKQQKREFLRQCAAGGEQP